MSTAVDTALLDVKDLHASYGQVHVLQGIDFSVHQGEVTTVEKGGTVYFLVLNASREAYGKLKEEYAGVVKSLALSAPAAPK